MKRCPSCNPVENEDKLAFCRADGTALVGDSFSISSDSSPALRSANASSEIETSLLPHSTDAAIIRATGATAVFDAPPASARTRKLSRRKHGRIVLLITAGLLVVAFPLFAYPQQTRNSGTTTAIDSIAVLPFANVSGDPNAEYLSDGITESIINSLSQLSQLKVMAGSTVFQYKGKDIDPRKVGHDLGVRAVLTGRVLQVRDNLMISVELVDASNNHLLWGEQYVRNLADVFAVQQEIVQKISENLRLKVTGAEQKQLAKRPTENLVGTWRLVATQQRLADGTVRPEVGLGPRGIGYITYSDSGVVCAFLSNPDRPRWKVQTAPTDAELRSSVEGMVAYCGTYEVNDAEGYVLHHVQMDKVPNVAGTDRKRYFTISGNRLVLRPSPLPEGIKDWTIEWERVPRK